MGDERLVRELSSWKEIADYLGITVRTAQKWEGERGLPVHRLPGGKGRVYALPAELASWKAAGLHRPPNGSAPREERRGWGRTIWLGLSGLVVLVVFSLWYVFVGRFGSPGLWRVDLNTLTVQDARGRELWRKPFGENLLAIKYDQSHLEGKNHTLFADVDDDGATETLFVLHYQADGGETSALVCLSDRGVEEWRFTPGRAVRTARESFSTRYRITKVAVARFAPGRPNMILVVSYNYPGYPTQVALLSPDGKLVREYWHSGYIGGFFGDREWSQIADLNNDGKAELYLGGVNNASSQATLVVLDPETMGGASVEVAPEFQLVGFEPGREVARVLFPRTCLNKGRYAYNGVSEVGTRGAAIHVMVVEELDPPAAGVSYDLDERLQLLGVRPTDGFRTTHLQLFSTGVLNHQWSTDEEVALQQIRVLRAGDDPGAKE